jgi:hypothetical protein
VSREGRAGHVVLPDRRQADPDPRAGHHQGRGRRTRRHDALRIPKYRLPRDILDAEISRILDMSIQNADLSVLDGVPGVTFSDGVVEVGPDLMTGHRHRGHRPRQEGGPAASTPSCAAPAPGRRASTRPPRSVP